MTLAEVVRLDGVEPHPDAERLVILRLSNGLAVVAGPHYEPGVLGVYVPGGAAIPGWMAEDGWLVKKGDRWLTVEARVIRGIWSPGLFFGRRWRNGPLSPEQSWAPWRDRWAVGDDVSAYLGVVRPGMPVP